MILDSVTDEQWNEHVMEGEAFTAESIVAGVGGMSPEGQIFNPVASGVRLRLRCLEMMAFVGGPINSNVRRHDVALPNLDAPPFGGPENMLGGGAAPAAEFRFDNVVALVGSPFWLILSAGQTRKDYSVLHQDWGHDLLPGQGMMMSGAVGGFLIIGWQWVEVPL